MTEPGSGIATRLASQSAFVVFGNLFTLFLGLPFQIYVANVLGADQLGAFGLFETISQTAAALCGFGLAATLVRFIPQQLELGQGRKVKRLLATVFAISLLTGIGAAGALAVSGPQVGEWLTSLRPYTHLFPLVGVMTLLAVLMAISTQALRGFLDIRYMILVASFLQLLLKVAVAVALFLLGWQLLGYVVAVVVSMGLALAGMLWGLRGHVRNLANSGESVHSGDTKSWWRYSRVMYAGTLLGMAAAPLERFLLAGNFDLASVGVLMVVRQLQGFPQVLLQVMITVIAPMFVAARARENMKEVNALYHIATDWVCRAGVPLLAFLVIFGGDVLALFGPAFKESGRWPLAILVGGQLVNMMTGPLGAMLNMLGYEKRLLQLNLVSDGIFFLSLLTIAPRFGLLGVAVANALSMGFLNLSALHLMRRELRLTWWSARLTRLLGPTLACAATGLLFLRIIETREVWTVVVGLVVVYATFAAGYVFSGISDEDRELMRAVRERVGLSGRR